MEPDPIRQAFAAYVQKVGLREDPKYCSFVDFTAGAKWAARKAAEIAENGCVGEHFEHEYSCCNQIRKHFGVEAVE